MGLAQFQRIHQGYARVRIQPKGSKNRLKKGKPIDDFQRHPGGAGALGDHWAGGFRHKWVSGHSIDHSLRALPKFQDFFHNGSINLLECLTADIQVIEGKYLHSGWQTSDCGVLVGAQPDLAGRINDLPGGTGEQSRIAGTKSEQGDTRHGKFLLNCTVFLK